MCTYVYIIFTHIRVPYEHKDTDTDTRHKTQDTRQTSLRPYLLAVYIHTNITIYMYTHEYTHIYKYTYTNIYIYRSIYLFALPKIEAHPSPRLRSSVVVGLFSFDTRSLSFYTRSRLTLVCKPHPLPRLCSSFPALA
jgi:hypothetical protein